MYRGEDDKDLAWDYYNMLNSMFKGNEFDFFDAANLPSPFVNTQERISTILDKASIRQFNKSDPKRRKGRRSKREEDEFYTIIDTVKFKRNDIEVKKSYEERYNKILDVASLKDRVEMRFDSDPFESKHLIQEIFQAAQEGCITKSEKVSLIRSKFRLPQNEISEIEKDLDESYNNKAKGIDDPARDTNTKVNESNKIDEIVISEKKNEINSNESTKKKRKTKTKNETESDGNPVKKKRK